jgi:hypothetical protein
MRSRPAELGRGLDQAVRQWWFRVPAAAALLAIWSYLVWWQYTTRGLFVWLGYDYSTFLTQAVVYRELGPSAIYDLGPLWEYAQRLSHHAVVALPFFRPSIVAYPPVFAWLMGPFTWLEPAASFVLWTALNLAAGLWLSWRIGQFFPRVARAWVAVLVLTSYPVAYTLYMGQINILLAVVVGEFFLALRRMGELPAGVWLGVLIFKPTFGVLIGPVLLWKRRWAAALGAAASIAVVLLASVAVAGVSWLALYPNALSEMGGFQGAISPTQPQDMINWRSLVLFVAREIEDWTRVAASIALAIPTVAVMALALRGAWSSREPTFPAKITLILVTTVLVNYHSPPYSAAVLALPLAALLAEQGTRGYTRAAAAAAAFLPTLVLFLTQYSVPRTSRLFAVLLLALYACLLIEMWAGGRRAAGESVAREVERPKEVVLDR